MVTQVTTHVISCRFCQSRDVIRHGVDGKGNQRYRCHACRKTFRLPPGSAAHPEQLRRQVLAAYEERCSMRGVCQVFANGVGHISRQTLVTWLKKSQAPAPAPGDAAGTDAR